MGWLEMFQDPKSIGLMVMIAIGAIVVGRVVHNLWPKHRTPALWGSLAAILVAGALAYMGSAEAAVVVWVFVAGAAVMGVLAMMF